VIDPGGLNVADEILHRVTFVRRFGEIELDGDILAVPDSDVLGEICPDGRLASTR